MGWLKLDDQYDDHEKIVAAGPLAELLDLRAMLFCARRETDGFVPYTQLSALCRDIPAPKKKAALLVKVGRWTDSPDEGGWWVHDFLEYNPSRVEKEAEREAARARMNKARSAKPKKNNARSSENVRPNNARSSDNPLPQVLSEPKSPTGDLIAEYIRACKVRPPQRFLGHLSREVKALVDEGINPDVISAALAKLRAKAMHPSTLASFVNEELNRSNVTELHYQTGGTGKLVG